MLHPETPANIGMLQEAETAASTGIKVIPLGVHNIREIDQAVTAFATETHSGLIPAPHAITLQIDT